MAKLTWVRGAELPSAAFWWTDRQKQLIDFSTGHTFTLKLGRPGATAVLTKTSGITGAAGAGVEPTGTPNLVVAWSANELDIPGGSYMLTITATDGSSRDRILYDTLTILEPPR